jgi:hypothetical protein
MLGVQEQILIQSLTSYTQQQSPLFPVLTSCHPSQQQHLDHSLTSSRSGFFSPGRAAAAPLLLLKQQ